MVCLDGNSSVVSGSVMSDSDGSGGGGGIWMGRHSSVTSGVSGGGNMVVVLRSGSGTSSTG